MLSYKVKKYQFPWFSVQQIAKCDLDHQSRVDGGERQQTELEEAGCERRDDAWPPARFSDNTRTTSHKHKSMKPFSTNMKRVWRNPISPETEITWASWQIRRAVELRPHWVTAEAAASTPNIQLTVFFPFWSHHSFTSTSFWGNFFHRGNYWIGWLGLRSCLTTSFLPTKPRDLPRSHLAVEPRARPAWRWTQPLLDLGIDVDVSSF